MPVVESVARRQTTDRRNPQTTNRSAGSSGTSAFSSLLQTSLAGTNKTSRKKMPLSFADLMEELDEYEQDLLQKPSHPNFLRYRDQVRKLTSFILKNEFKIRTVRDRKQKEFEVVHYINRNLAETLQEILRRNPDTVMILRLMGELRGLVLDLIG